MLKNSRTSKIVQTKATNWTLSNSNSTTNQGDGKPTNSINSWKDPSKHTYWRLIELFRGFSPSPPHSSRWENNEKEEDNRQKMRNKLPLAAAGRSWYFTRKYIWLQFISHGPDSLLRQVHPVGLDRVLQWRVPPGGLWW